jgi:CheY-like chemotaxis protein
MESASPLPTPSQQRSIGQILKAGWYLLELINEVLDLALIESGKLSLSQESVSLAEVMQECATLIEAQALNRDISVSFPKFDIAYFVKVDRTRLKQAVINLLTNAIKYNRVGGTVVVACVVSTPGRIRIRVEDSGEGLSREKIAQLFQLFNRLGQEMGGPEGTGIGLVTAKRLVELMDGTIGVESTVGKGSVFWIELNLTHERQHVIDTGESITIAPVKSQDGAQVRTVLYVEDNPANLMLVEDLIARQPDIQLLSATDANRGIEIARAAQPDMILMDINLPGISGIQALKILCEDTATAHIPVVALSGNAIPRDIKKGLEAGFFRYLTKPINVNEFMNALDATLKFAKMESARANPRVTRTEPV